MTTTATGRTAATGLETRLLQEGYGDGAWHGPDLKAALADVAPSTAFWRPGPGRHNIAEVALHHAYCVGNARARLTGVQAEPFVLEGDDWFTAPDPSTLSWSSIADLVRREHERLAAAVADVEAGRTPSRLSESERIDLMLGVTCHAVYHAGQVQLIKRLAGA
jgi:hypothetical protein